MLNKILLEYDECSVCHGMSNLQQFHYDDKSGAAIRPPALRAGVEVVHAIHRVDRCEDCRERERGRMALILQHVSDERRPLFWDDRKGGFSNIW